MITIFAPRQRMSGTLASVTGRRGAATPAIAALLAIALCVAVGAGGMAVAQDAPVAPAPDAGGIGDDLLEEAPGSSPQGEADTQDGAAEAPAFGGGARDFLDANEFRRRYENKTVHLLFGNDHYGSEYYLPDDRSIWIAADGPCQLGDWAYVSPQFCFQYGDDGPHCWTVYDQGGQTYAESVDGLVLRIYAVEERPLTCDPGLFS